jgi:predicted phosphoribosyltransferase
MIMTGRFMNRRDAGRRLAEKLLQYRGRSDVLVLALPRGGVPVAAEVAIALEAPLDVLVVRKLGYPGLEEVAIGAIASGGIQVVNRELVQQDRIPAELIEAVATRERRELARREAVYRGTAPPQRIAGKLVILVDDGIATGSSMRVAVEALRAQKPWAVVVASPVIAASTRRALRPLADDVVSVIMPHELDGVGLWYEDFRQTTDEEVRQLLAAARSREAKNAGVERKRSRW